MLEGKQQGHTQEQNFAWDLAKVTLTSLALLGLGGCREQSVAEKIAARPEQTVTAIIQNQEQWREKEVSIKATPVLISDNSTLYFSGGKHARLTLNLDLRYRLEPDQGSAEEGLIMIDHRSIRLSRGKWNPQHLSDYHVLPKSTFVVSGEITPYRSNPNQVYLKYLNSMHKEQEVAK